VFLTIDTAEQLPAAKAVIAAMYSVPDALARLTLQQLVHVLRIADMLQADAAMQQAIQALAAADTDQCLPAAVFDALAALQTCPACLLQHLPALLCRAPCCCGSTTELAATAAADSSGSVQRLLLAWFGDLEAAWADMAYSELLLGLPLPAMQLLLSSDQLRVASEDTVLFIACVYAQRLYLQDPQQLPSAALAQLVRAPQLSQLALSNAVLAREAEQMLLAPYLPELRPLLSLKQKASAAEVAQHMQTAQNIPGSWRLGPRQLVPLLDGVWLEWQLPVEQLKAACRASFAQQTRIVLNSPTHSPVISGTVWRLHVTCQQQRGGTVVGLFASTDSFSSGIYFKGSFDYHVQDRTRIVRGICYPSAVLFCGEGCNNYFGLQPMAAGGWDETVWAAAGLPTSGEMLLQLHVHSME
jgi:hypothetical protein